MKIKVPELKKKLKEYDQKELIQLVTELFKASKDVQSILSVKFLGDEATEELYNNAKKAVESGFYTKRGEPTIRLAEAKKAIANFEKLSGDEEKTLDLMLYYVELGVDFTNSFGDIDYTFYNSMVGMYDKVTSKCAMEEEYYHSFASRLKQILYETADIGWGFHEALVDSFSEMGYSDDDEEDEEESL
ncbi:DUF6155 family protein [Bacillus sp. B-jedd]|uniref:DUF6155 family protein n=1 Tax=Bacillus sp. B-jedd TaxID=1476857 RepID=UPI0005156D97|nr:DUF6155 family protein [Bacillus sp. B-jedd]CEG26389.1 hypothetical protein BN1002_01234 [Bacillus sp. B-jedd]